ncbi:hypothetical protein A3B56_00520 [Candidatus Roizmanbacteria bacterium RIFCSPLOWO2_01_FULL_45_11]|uniref:Uncharacterized protein n=1 Tax=Candidatus Roizmanbacteria bacterium RIFCSPLOWO2_01_FULL_45_11 TaxID=1802070 RepID=A0A1F7JEX2_9BACT|nr:MAG: hypothetical protein A3B56_00520 [Candidatus Roizmanbacteria bacterium RIFCSPLOWO2_01_FULL_45_11]
MKNGLLKNPIYNDLSGYFLHNKKQYPMQKALLKNKALQYLFTMQKAPLKNGFITVNKRSRATITP